MRSGRHWPLGAGTAPMPSGLDGAPRGSGQMDTRQARPTVPVGLIVFPQYLRAGPAAEVPATRQQGNEDQEHPTGSPPLLAAIFPNGQPPSWRLGPASGPTRPILVQVGDHLSRVIVCFALTRWHHWSASLVWLATGRAEAGRGSGSGSGGAPSPLQKGL